MLPARQGAGSAPALINDFGPFSVLQYNILSNSDSDPTRAERKGLEVADLLASFDADVLCLQEVYQDWFHKILQPTLGKAGYKGYFTPRGEMLRFHAMKPGDLPDGCAIFYKASRFVAKDFEAQQLRHALFEKGQRRFGASEFFTQRMLGPGHVIQVAMLDLIPSKELFNSGSSVSFFWIRSVSLRNLITK